MMGLWLVQRSMQEIKKKEMKAAGYSWHVHK
jgi:hypothetical protein